MLDSCNYSKGLVEIWLEHMDDSLPFFQMLPFSYSGIAVMTGLYYLTRFKGKTIWCTHTISIEE